MPDDSFDLDKITRDAMTAASKGDVVGALSGGAAATKQQDKAAQFEAEGTAKILGEAKKERKELGGPKTLELKSYQPPPPTDPWTTWGSSGMWLASTMGLLGRRSITNAMTAASGYMNAVKQNDEKAAKQHFDQWKVENENAIKAAEWERDNYKIALGNIDADSKEGLAILKAQSYAMGHPEQAEFLETAVPGAAKEIMKQKGENLRSLQNHAVEIQKEQHRREAIKAVEQAEVDYRKAATPEEKQAAAEKVHAAKDRYLMEIDKLTQSGGEKMIGGKMLVAPDGSMWRESGITGEVEQRINGQWEKRDTLPKGIKPVGASTMDEKGWQMFEQPDGHAWRINANSGSIERLGDDGWVKATSVPTDARRIGTNMPSPMGDEVGRFFAEQYLAGDRSVMTFATRNKEAQNELRTWIVKVANERGMSPEMVAAKIAEYQGELQEQRTIGQRLGAVEVSATEAKKVASLVESAWKELPRGQFKPFNQLASLVADQTNSPEQGRAYMADFSLSTAYARALNPQGVPRESDIALAQTMLGKADSYEKHMAVVHQMLSEIDQLLESPKDVRGAVSERIRTQRTKESGSINPLVDITGEKTKSAPDNDYSHLWK